LPKSAGKRIDDEICQGEERSPEEISSRRLDYELVEDTSPFAVRLSKYSKYAPMLKNSIAFMETPDWRIFFMKDMAAINEATKAGWEMYQGNFGHGAHEL
jgi:hypothetical protein